MCGDPGWKSSRRVVVCKNGRRLTGDRSGSVRIIASRCEFYLHIGATQCTNAETIHFSDSLTFLQAFGLASGNPSASSLNLEVTRGKFSVNSTPTSSASTLFIEPFPFLKQTTRAISVTEVRDRHASLSIKEASQSVMRRIKCIYTKCII